METGNQTKFISLMFSKDKKNTNVEGEIKRNISNILNLRCTTKLEDFLSIKENSFDFRNYGLPEVSHLNFENVLDIDMLCRAIKISISAFEPRISNFQITFLKFDKMKKSVHLLMKGYITQLFSTINIILKIGVWEFYLQ